MTRIGTHSGPTATARSIPDYCLRDPSIGRGIVRRGPRRPQLCSGSARRRALGPGAPDRAGSPGGPPGGARRAVVGEEEGGSSGAVGAGRDSDCGPSSTAAAKAKGSAKGRRSADSRGPSGGDPGNGFRAGRRGRRYLESTCPALEDASSRSRRRGERGRGEEAAGREPNPSEPAGLELGLGREDARRPPTTPAEIEWGTRRRDPKRPRARRESLPNAPNTAPNTPNAAPNTPNAAGSFGAVGAPAPHRPSGGGADGGDRGAFPETRRRRRRRRRRGLRRRSSASDPRTPGGDGGARSRAAPVEGDGDAPEPPWVPDGPSSAAFPRRRSRRRVSPAAFLLLLRPRRREVVSQSSTTRLRLRRAFLAPRPATRRAVDFAAEVAADAALERRRWRFCGEPASAAAALATNSGDFGRA